MRVSSLMLEAAELSGMAENGTAVEELRGEKNYNAASALNHKDTPHTVVLCCPALLPVIFLNAFILECLLLHCRVANVTVTKKNKKKKSHFDSTEQYVLIKNIFGNCSEQTQIFTSQLLQLLINQPGC